MLPFDAVQVPAYHRVAGRHLRIVDCKLVAAACRAGVEVHVWTIGDERTMRELIALGVNGIVTNRTDLLAGVLAS
ncbi:glycerophosphodiester phosphodiesterase family protein [Rothia sp. SD9660Na]|uniref:glycerophosphodiester phosphodiesterase family protein n=1 Tax=Rothia sp. SD9660Na TaxID=3047030 RepID=UPI0024BB66A0|nr:glycerophosphodiester phosphodiesterase family protein [Rothia sp. SD9660Na]WHS50591.1 glycerophosphodiester phosphodiesterase family protein [Rothia sp. SD9660Na]